MALSRRGLIHLVGQAGGVAAAYHTMAAMGLLPVPEAYAGPPQLPPGKGRRIVIIGAGIAGMVLAWELRKAGYAPLILEARSRPGGRNWSLRRGDAVEETNSLQRVAWDAGLFRTADCLIAGGSWNWSGRYCRLDRLVPAQPFIPG